MQHVACSNGNGKSHTNIVVVPLSSTFSLAATTIRTQLGCRLLAASLTKTSLSSPRPEDHPHRFRCFGSAQP